MYNNNLNDPFLILFTKSSRIELLSMRINSFLFPSLFLTEFQLFPFETTFFLRRDFSSDIVLLIFTCRSCWNGLRAIRNRENKDLIKGNFNSEDRSEESDPDERSIYLVPDLCNKVLNFDSRIQNSLWLNPRSGFGYIWISDIYSRKNWNTKEKWKEVKEYSEFHRSKNQYRLWEGEKAIYESWTLVEFEDCRTVYDAPFDSFLFFFFLLFSWTIVHSCDHDSAAQTDVAPSETRNKSCCIPREELEIPCQFLFPFSWCKKWYPKIFKK